MNKSSVLEILKEYISKEILDGKDMGLDASTPLLEWGIINSMEIARLVTFIQVQFSVEIPSEKITIEYFKDLNTISDLVIDISNEKDLA